VKEPNVTGKYFDYPHITNNVADEHIAQGALTNSKRPESFIEGVYPRHFVSGQQSYLFDEEGKRYVDFLCNLGTNLFGYTNPDIIDSIRGSLNRGVGASLGSPLEAYFAMKLKDKFPYMEQIKILKSGSEGCSAAVRIARAFTGKLDVYSEGYHGWHDQFVSLTPPAKGVHPHEYTLELEYEDQDVDKHTAAVIVEPVILDFSSERRQWLERLRKECTKYGALLIFDETITAYRFPGYSVANYWGIEPDLTVMGKALANGMPISVVGGKKEIMSCDYFVSSTYAGEQLTLAAAVECLKLVGNEYAPERLWELGSEFVDKLSEAVSPIGMEVLGYPTRGGFAGNRNMTSLFFQEMCKAGFFFHPKTWFYNLHLHKHIDDVCQTAKIICHRILDGEYRMEGQLPLDPFRR
jgi:glutamate-1-semialdehyde 2,1-aminomutase/spore coat polysaccharide biosynthesis protein SpsF